MTQKFVVLPVEVAERALYALQEAEMLMEHRQNVDLRLASIQSIQEALKQQNPWCHATVPEGWKLVPVEPKISMKQAALNASRRWAECDAPLPRTQELWASEVCWKAMIEAAPQPPIIEESSSAPQQKCKRQQPSVAKVIGVNEEFGPVLLWHRAWTDFPVGTKLYTNQQPGREPQFDAISVEQERLAVQFCAEIAGPRGGKPSLPDPVRLLEMAEALYRAEVNLI